MPESETRETKSLWRRPGAPLVWLAAVGVVVAVLAMLYSYGKQVRSEIDNFAIANSDSLQWSLAQLEVEFYHMETALMRATPEAPGSMAQFSRSFDIFYSRVRTVLEGRGFSEVIDATSVQPQIARLHGFVEHTAATIDAGPAPLAAALPQLRNEAQAVASDVREISLQGVREFATRAKNQRERVFDSLVRLATLSAALLATMTAGFTATGWLWRFGMRQARSLRLAKARLEAVIGTAIDAVIVVDQRARVLEFNGAAEQIFGYSRDEAMGRTLSDLIVPEHMIAAHEAGLRRHRAGATPRIAGHGPIGLQARRKDGTLFPAELSVTATRIDRVDLYVGYLRDITSRVAAEQELIAARDKAQAGERAQSAFVAVMSHEMRTPLNGLLGTLEILRETRLDAEQSRFVQAMQHAGEILLQHVNNTLDVERLDAGKLSLTRAAFDPRELAQQIVAAQASVAAARGNSLDVLTLGVVPHLLEGDAMRIRQVLLNLVGNAIKFTRDGSIAIEIEYHAEPGLLEYRVIDAGIGIPPEETARIFDDFVTLDPAQSRENTGSGLGLSIARRLVRAMGGEIGVESEPGEGSAFWLSLPAPVALPAAAATAAAATPGAAPSLAPPSHVLVVEDNDINRIVLCEMLRRGGHGFDEARDGVEGVERAAQRRYDAILLDLNMPRMNGIETTRALRSGSGPNRATPIIAITANVLPEVRTQLAAEGVSRVIAKPITRRGLDQVLAEVLTGAPEGGAASAALLPAAAPADRAALIDLVCYDDLASSLGAALFADTVARFITETEAGVAALSLPEARNDLAELARNAHRLAGSAALLGAARLHAALKAIETEARGLAEPPAQPGQLAARLAALAPLWADTRARLAQLAERGGTVERADFDTASPPTRG